MFNKGDIIIMRDNSGGYEDIPLGYTTEVIETYEYTRLRTLFVKFRRPDRKIASCWASRWGLAVVEYTPTQEGDREDDI
jgi:hypothetical protein